MGDTEAYYVRDASGQVLSEFQHKTNGSSSPTWNRDYLYVFGKAFGLLKNQVPAGPQRPWATGISSTALTLNWNAVPESDILGYAIERHFKLDANHNETVTPLISVPLTPRTWGDTFAAGATSYVRYKVYAVDTAANVSEPSEELYVRPSTNAAAPNPPTNLTPTIGDRMVSLQWTPSVPVIAGVKDIAGYYVERADVASGPYTRLNVGYLLSTPVFVDTVLVNGHSYTYRVVAVDTAGRVSSPSNAVTVVPRDGVPPGRLATVYAEADRTAGVIHVSWKNGPEEDIAQYRVYRSQTSGVRGFSSDRRAPSPGRYRTTITTASTRVLRTTMP